MASWWSQSWKHLTWTKKREKDHLVRFCGSSSFFKRLLCQPTSNTTPVRTPTWSAWFNQKIASCGKFLISQMIWNAIQDHFLMPFNKRRGSVCWRGGNSETAVHTYEVNKQVNKQVRGKVLEFFLPASKKSVFAGWRGRSTVGWREQKKPRCPRTWARWIRVYNRTLGSCLCPETDEGRRSEVVSANHASSCSILWFIHLLDLPILGKIYFDAIFIAIEPLHNLADLVTTPEQSRLRLMALCNLLWPDCFHEITHYIWLSGSCKRFEKNQAPSVRTDKTS